MSPVFSLLSLFAANPVFIQSVDAGPSDGHYELRIQGEADLSPHQVSGRTDGRRVTLYVEGARARSENRAWGSGDDHVKAYRHKDRLELEGRLPAATCTGGVRMVAGPGGSVIARVTCPTLQGRLSATNATQPVRSAQPQPVNVAPPADAAQALIDAVALAPAGSPVAVPAPAPAAKPEPTAEVKPRAVEVAQRAEPSAPAKAKGGAPTSVSLWGSAGKALLPILLLGGVAFAGLKFTRRRRSLGRHVRIVETTPLGPRRSLIVAKVGNETLLLGASEAGISLIQVRPDAEEASTVKSVDDDGGAEESSFAFARAKAKAEPQDSEGLWVDAMDGKGGVCDDLPEAGQVKLLSRLFRKRRQDIPESWPFANVLDASMMEDSVEDRELREKLALGMEARIP